MTCLGDSSLVFYSRHQLYCIFQSGQMKEQKREREELVEHSFDDYTFLNRWGLTFLGIWKSEAGTDEGSRRVLHRAHITALFVLLTLLLIPQWMDLYVLWGNVNANAETFVLNVFTIAALLKLWNFIAELNVFEDVLATMKNNWVITMSDTGPDHQKHKTILLEMAGKARDYTKRYGFLMYSTAVMYFISPLVGMQPDSVRVRKYPFFGWYYFDRFSNFYYGICYTSQVIIGIVVGTGNYAMDSIFLVAVYHSCAQLQILQNKLKKVGKDNSAYSKITPLIVKHQQEIRSQLKRNSQKLESLFNGSSLQQLLVSCVIICVIGFKLIIALDEGGFEFLIYIAFLILALLQIFLYCRPGDELINQSIEVGHAAYESIWTSLRATTIRQISMIILRSQRPIRITAGKIYVLSLQNFTIVLKTSLSFLSLLRAIYIKSDSSK